MKEIFICFIGLDGSGKSTLTKNIFMQLNLKNWKVKKIYGRYMPIFLKPLMSLGGRLFLKNRDRFNDYENYLEDKKSFFKNKPNLSKIYLWLMILEYYFEIAFKIKLYRKLGYSIISDRYVYDTIINDIAIDFTLSFEESKEILYKFWRFCPKPDITFFVKVPEKVAFERKNDIPSINYLQLRNSFYKNMSETENFLELDGTIKIKDLEEIILKKINEIKK